MRPIFQRHPFSTRTSLLHPGFNLLSSFLSNPANLIKLQCEGLRIMGRLQSALGSRTDSRHALLLWDNTPQLSLLDRHSDVADGPLLHLSLRLDGPGTHVRNEEHPRVVQQAGVDLRLVLVDVEANAADNALVQGVDEGGFIHDGAAGRVDDYDALLHDLELRRRDGVAGVRLRGGDQQCPSRESRRKGDIR
jgi:hypothetical protein